MSKKMIAMLGALALGFASSANAASSVDITYDLSNTVLNSPIPDCAGVAGGACRSTELLGGRMKIRYTSNSASSMPILSGPATLQSLTLSAHVSLGSLSLVTTGTFNNATSASINFSLVSSVPGSLLAGGTLTFGAAQVRATGVRHCGGHPIYTGFCVAVAGVITSLAGPLGPFTTIGTLSFAASPGSHGGAQSTRHTVSGSMPAYAPSAIAQAVGTQGAVFASGASILGREILREAEGHDPKVTPEPGTLLLLGTGTVGLALVGRATRRSRQS